MSCKACQTPFNNQQLYCHNCGAKVVTKRLTIKNIISDFIVLIWGWDNSFFKTLKSLLVSPEILLKEYVSGVRKKYMHPLSFLLIGATLFVIISNLFDLMLQEQIGEYNTNVNTFITNLYGANSSIPDYQEMNDKTLKYFNIIMLLNLPIYALLSYLIYRKPYNFAEHIIFNSYIQGLIMYITVIIFIFSMLVGNIYIYLILPLIITPIYYLFTFKRLHNHSIKKTIIKLFSFFLALFILLLIFCVIFLALGFLFAMMGGKLT